MRSYFFEEDPFVSNVEDDTEKNIITFNYRGTEDDQIDLLEKGNGQSITNYFLLQKTETDLEDVFMEITKGAK